MRREEIVSKIVGITLACLMIVAAFGGLQTVVSTGDIFASLASYGKDNIISDEEYAEDGVYITPQNKATATLYAYTPYAGSGWGGTGGGNYLFLDIYCDTFDFANVGSLKFNVGDKVRTTANLNVRDGPGLGYAVIATEPTGSTGVVVCSKPQEADTYTWWVVRYADGKRGWSAENWLEKIGSVSVITNAFCPYIHQCYDTRDEFNGMWACGATSAVMMVAYYGKVDAWPYTCSYPYSHVSNYGNYISLQYTSCTGEVFGDASDEVTNDASGRPAKGAYGYIHYPDGKAKLDRMVSYFRKHDLDSQEKYYPSEADVRAELDAGHPVPASTKLTPAGHWVVIKGYTNDGYYIVNDPNGCASQDASGNPVYKGDPVWGLGFNYCGEDVLYTWDEMKVSEKWIAKVHPTTNNPPQLSDGYVDPPSGDTSTDFYYYVTYFDPDGDSPTVRQVYIDGTPYTMSWYSASDSWITYRYGPKNLLYGSHSYYFYFEDGRGGAARLPTSGSYSGPPVSQPTYSVTVYVQGFPSTYSTKVYLDENYEGTIPGGGSKTFSDLTGSHTISMDEYVSGSSGTRYHCPSNSWSFSSGGSHAFDYHTEYYLTVNSNPGGIDDPRPSGWYDAGTTVTIQCDSPVSAGTGRQYVFTQWSGDASATSLGTNVYMDRPRTATANYKTRYQLNIIASPSGGGSTSPATGTYWHDSGTSVTVSETPAAGYIFDHWDLDGSNVGSSLSYAVTMDAPHTLTAIFKIPTPTYDVTVKAHCNTQGIDISVSFTWDGITYTTPKTFTGKTGSHTVVIAERDANGHPFIKWVKDGVDYSTSRTITISSGGTYTAIYEGIVTYQVTFYARPTSGTITAGGVTKTNGATGTYASGARVRVVANAPSGYSFYEWQTTEGVSVDSKSNPDTYMTVSGTGTIKAIFVSITKFTISPNPFSPNGDGVKDTTRINATFSTTVKWVLRIEDSAGYEKIKWEGTGTSLTQVWNGKDKYGNLVPDGKYKCTVSAGYAKKSITITVDTTRPTITGVTDSPDPFNPRAGQTTTIGYTLSEKCALTIKIFNSAGALVRTLPKQTQLAGANSMIWNGKDRSGIIVPNGTYTYKIYVTDMAGNKGTTYPASGKVTVRST